MISVTGMSIKQIILWIVLVQCIKTRAIYSISREAKLSTAVSEASTTVSVYWKMQRSESKK